MDLFGLGEVEDYLQALKLCLQVLAVFSVLTFLAVVTLGSVIAWQLSKMTGPAARATPGVNTTATQPYHGNYGQPPQQPPYRS